MPRGNARGSTDPAKPHRASPSRQNATPFQQTVALLRRFDIKAKRGLGQNFLTDPDALDQILAAADLTPDDVVLEVGPGLGILTAELARRCGRVVAVEIDPKMVAALKDVLAGIDNVTVVEKDILEADPQEILAEVLGKTPDAVTSGSYKVVANLPYYITSLVLRHFLEARAKPGLLVLTVQKEVAERITAKPGDMSLLAVSVQVYGRPRLVAKVPAASFLPKPKVDSAIVRIDVYDKPAVTVDNMEAFFEIVHAGFSQPRKQLHNALAQRIWLPPGKAGEALGEAGIDPSRRAATLTLDEWAELYQTLKRFKAAKE